jgi:hypothetical protein
MYFLSPFFHLINFFNTKSNNLRLKCISKSEIFEYHKFRKNLGISKFYDFEISELNRDFKISRFFSQNLKKKNSKSRIDRDSQHYFKLKKFLSFYRIQRCFRFQNLKL